MCSISYDYSQEATPKKQDIFDFCRLRIQKYICIFIFIGAEVLQFNRLSILRVHMWFKMLDQCRQGSGGVSLTFRELFNIFSPLEIYVLQKSYFLWEFQAVTLYVWPKPRFFVMSGLVYFREIILASSWKIDGTTPRVSYNANAVAVRDMATRESRASYQWYWTILQYYHPRSRILFPLNQVYFTDFPIFTWSKCTTELTIGLMLSITATGLNVSVCDFL